LLFGGFTLFARSGSTESSAIRETNPGGKPRKWTGLLPGFHPWNLLHGDISLINGYRPPL
jgi:hypothetical protein